MCSPCYYLQISLLKKKMFDFVLELKVGLLTFPSLSLSPNLEQVSDLYPLLSNN